VGDEHGTIGDGERDDELVGVDSAVNRLECGDDAGLRCGGKFRMAQRGGHAALAGTIGVIGAWLSLVERLVRDQEAGGSNPLAPTMR
jgi:hypothetical protein